MNNSSLNFTIFIIGFLRLKIKCEARNSVESSGFFCYEAKRNKECGLPSFFLVKFQDCIAPFGATTAGLPPLMWCTVASANMHRYGWCGAPCSLIGCTVAPVIFPAFLRFFLLRSIGQARGATTEIPAICAFFMHKSLGSCEIRPHKL